MGTVIGQNFCHEGSKILSVKSLSLKQIERGQVDHSLGTPSGAAIKLKAGKLQGEIQVNHSRERSYLNQFLLAVT